VNIDPIFTVGSFGNEEIVRRESKSPCTGIWEESALLAKTLSRQGQKEKKEHQQRALRGGGAMALLPVVLDRLFAFSSVLFYSSECFYRNCDCWEKYVDFFL
jgi:hypothetical protein